MTGEAADDGPRLRVPDRLVIEGGNRLVGTVDIPGAKNAALPMIAATLLTDETCRLTNVPLIEDVEIMVELVRRLGADVCFDRSARTLTVTASSITSTEPDAELVRIMRASFLVVGPLLSRFGRIECIHPGGCELGVRPVNVDITGFRAMGARIDVEPSRYSAIADRLDGAHVYLDYPSHTGTENLVMAATLARGYTTIVHASREPEVIQLIQFLKSMGADIRGEGTSVIQVRGRGRLYGTGYRVMPDRMVAGTFAIAVGMCGGAVVLNDVNYDDLEPVLHKLVEVGADIEREEERITVRSQGKLMATELHSMPHPGFPTDKQAEMGVLLTQADGDSIVVERVFDSRFGYVSALRKMGARIEVNGARAVINGVSHLQGSQLTAGNDLRSGAALTLAGLVAEGVTTIDSVRFVQRGYEDLARDLAMIGANVHVDSYVESNLSSAI